MKTTNILSKYLTDNGVITKMGDGDELSGVNTSDDNSDAKVIELLEKSAKEKDYLIILIFALVLTVCSILAYKIAVDVSGKIMLICVPLIIVFVGIMHKLWKDKVRIEKLTILLFVLPKVQRLKLIMAILKDTNEVNLNDLVKKIRL